jgi:ubiquinone/menaquinone biosynthesis C-methylase UbiE
MAIGHAAALAQRELEELTRSAEEARDFVLTPADCRQVERYLNPPADAPYSLEYAYHLLGNISGKNIIDLGCGTGENLVPLAAYKANVTGIDVSPHLVRLAQDRIDLAGSRATVRVGSAYHTELSDESVDVIFCIALIHHLEIALVRDEMWRVLKKGGVVILQEPTRFSRIYAALRKLLPTNEHSSEHEHPLTKKDLECLGKRFTRDGVRYFRLPFVPLIDRLVRPMSRSWIEIIHRLSSGVIQAFPWSEHFATVVVMRLRK